MFPPPATSCRVPPAVSTVGDFFRSYMAAAPAGNGRQAGSTLVALEHEFLMADAKPALDAQLQHAQPWSAQEACFNAGASVDVDRLHGGLAAVSVITA